MRASGVISSQAARAVGEEVRAFFKSVGMLCIVPEEMDFVGIGSLYQFLMIILALVTHSFESESSDT